MADARIHSNGINGLANGCNGHAKNNFNRAAEVDDVSPQRYFSSLEQLPLPKYSILNSCHPTRLFNTNSESSSSQP
jgi:hypothetical protein